MSNRNPLDNLLVRIVNDITDDSDSDSDYEDDLINSFNLHNNVTPSQPKLGQENCYEVESILGDRWNGPRREFLIRWVNPRFSDEWLDQDDINSALIQRYELQNQVQQHNQNIQLNRVTNQLPNSGNGGITGKAYIYTRVSDPEKTKNLFQKSCAQEANQGTSKNNSSNSFGPGMQSFQNYCSNFPTANFSLDYQKNTGFKYCLDNNLEIALIEMDDGLTAKNPDKLPGLQNILKKIKKGDCLVFTDFSRFSRHTVKGIQILDHLHDQGIIIRSVLDEISYDTPAARHNARQALSNAQFYSELTSQKTKEAQQNIRNKGGYIGRLPPFGYKIYRQNNIRKLKKKKSEQIVLKFIKSYFERYQNTKGIYAKIAETLNRQKHRYRGRKFTSNHIGLILRQLKKTNPNLGSQQRPVPYFSNQIRREVTMINQKHRRQEKRQERANQNRGITISNPSQHNRNISKPNLSLSVQEPMEVDSPSNGYFLRHQPRINYQNF